MIQQSRHWYKILQSTEATTCNVTIPRTTLLSSTTGKNCTGEGGDSIFSHRTTTKKKETQEAKET
jgi:hypothetical protein